MIRLLTLRYAMLLAPLTLTSLGWGASGNALVVHDGTGGLNTSVTNNLSSKLTSAGYTVTTNVGVPGGSLSGYAQIWDVRFNNIVLSGSDNSAYLAFLTGGGSLFLMGENSGFNTRNNSLVSFVQSAGGGTITFSAPNNVQTVQAPFGGPTAVATVTFLAGNGAIIPGNAGFITKDTANLAIASVFGPGSMSGAPAGTLILVFDVNFLDSSATAPLQALTDNMIAYLAAPVPVTSGTPVVDSPRPVPTLSEWAMILLACGLALVASRRILAKGAVTPQAR